MSISTRLSRRSSPTWCTASGIPCSTRSSRATSSALHSFPTRRSSDLGDRRGGPQGPCVLRAVDRPGENRPRRRHPEVGDPGPGRSEEHTSELQSRQYLVCRLLLEKKKEVRALRRAGRPRGGRRQCPYPPGCHVGVRQRGVPLRAFHARLDHPALRPRLCTLSLHDALPISATDEAVRKVRAFCEQSIDPVKIDRDADIPKSVIQGLADRKSTRLNSSHANISYAVFCLKKKKKFARYVAPAVHVAAGVNVHIHPAVTSEFANVVYRFGHSMLD